MDIDLDALPSFAGQTPSDGAPLQLPVTDIDEDPGQPRREFEPQSLRELADSIGQHGVLQAISVRRHPDDPDRWMLNFGARRLRACRLLGLDRIPATVNDAASGYAQVIENEQREGLKPLELALFVQARLAEGQTQAQIARELGKSRSYVTYATALIDAPQWLMALYRQGRCGALHELHDLRRLHTVHPAQVDAFLARGGTITRDSLQLLRSSIAAAEEAGEMSAASEPASEPAMESVQPVPPATTALAAARTEPACPLRTAAVSEDSVPGIVDRSSREQSFALLALWGDQVVEVLVDAAPDEDAKVFVRSATDAVPRAVAVVELRLLRIVRR